MKYEIIQALGSYQIKLDNNRIFFDVPKEIIDIIISLEEEYTKTLYDSCSVETFKCVVDENAQLREEKQKLIKYLEDRIEEMNEGIEKYKKYDYVEVFAREFRKASYQEILERVISNGIRRRNVFKI